MNKLYKSLIYDRQVSLSVLETKDLVNDAIKIHGLDDVSAEILGGLLTACAYMAGCLKNPVGAVSLTVKSNDGSATAGVSGDIDGHIRGYIENGGGGLKGGTLTVIKDDGFYRPFVGTCELGSEDISENLTEYFRMSEQIPTYVSIGVRVANGKCLSAGGVIMQLLPGTSPENAEKSKEKMLSFKNAAELFSRCGAEEILKKYFGTEAESGGLYETFPEYKCNCSENKIGKVIISLGKGECEKIIEEQGNIKVHCHYCNKDYIFTRGDVEKLFGK